MRRWIRLLNAAGGKKNLTNHNTSLIYTNSFTKLNFREMVKNIFLMKEIRRKIFLMLESMNAYRKTPQSGLPVSAIFKIYSIII